jgi:hypothetical protein
MMTTSVIAATVRRRVQLMPRLTHHSNAQLITTGTMVSSCNLASALIDANSHPFDWRGPRQLFQCADVSG